MPRGNGKQDRIIDSLRQQITAGHWPPGSRLPSHLVLQKQYATTAVTISRATRRLVEDGYLHSRERSGVYVVDRPPHLHRFGVAFHAVPGSANWSKMEDVICSQATQSLAGLDCSFVPYFGIEPGSHHPDVARLAADITGKRLGGLFFATDPWQLYGTPIMDSPLPRAAVMMPKEFSSVTAFNFSDYMDRAVGWLREQGCQRLAVIQSARVSQLPTSRMRVEYHFSEYDMPFLPHLLQYAHLEYPASAAQIVRLLLELPADRRPDGLIVGDDNLLEAVEETLLELGVDLATDLRVISHCNFPAASHLRLPIQRIGVDMRDLLLQVAAALQAPWLGRPSAEFTRLPAVFEREFQARWSPAATAVDRPRPLSVPVP